MIIAKCAAEAAATRFARRTPEGAAIWRTDYFGPPPSPVGSGSVDPNATDFPEYIDPAPGEVRPPQAFLVEQEPGAIVHAHFHFVDQFQVVVGGDGSIGKEALAPVTVHFAGANTPYGPIQPGARGLRYFTLRASADTTGAQFMPAARSRRRSAPWRHALAPTVASSEEGLADRRNAEIETVLLGQDGLAILMLRLPPSGTLTCPNPAEGNGQSLLVTAGSIEHDGGTLGTLSALFVERSGSPHAVSAGPAGADVLLLQFPRHD